MTAYLVPQPHSRHATTLLFWSGGDDMRFFQDEGLELSLLNDVNNVVKQNNTSSSTEYSRLREGYRYPLGSEEPYRRPVKTHKKFKQSNGKDWRDRAKTKKIVMAPYKVYTISRVHHPNTKSIDHGHSSYEYADLELMGVVTIKTSPNGGEFPFYKGLYIVGGLGVQLPIQYMEMGVLYAPEPDFETMVNNLVECNTIGKRLQSRCVTATLAAANRGTLDALTEMAEMPSTIKELFALLKGIAKSLRSLKTKELKLSHSFSTRRKDIIKSIDDEISDLRAALTAPMNPRKRRRLIAATERRIARLEKMKTRRLRDLAFELSDAMATVWLSYRYSIMPMVYTADDLLRTLGALYSDYVSEREKENNIKMVAPELAGFTLKSDPSSTHRCLIKTLIIAKSNLSKLNTLLGANILVTAWELMSKSLIVDWVLNVGDLLATFCLDGNWDDRKCSYSIRSTAQQFEYYHESSGASIVYVVDMYERDIIDPHSHTGLHFQEEWLNPKRMADLAAFALPALKRMLKNVT